MPSGDSLDALPGAWASESLLTARKVFDGVTFGAHTARGWTAYLPPDYAARMEVIKRAQIELAGARLAYLLEQLLN